MKENNEKENEKESQNKNINEKEKENNNEIECIENESKKDEVKKDEKIIDYTNLNNSYLSNLPKSELTNTKISNTKNESTKEKPSPVQRNISIKNSNSKDKYNTFRRENTFNNYLIFSPFQEQSFDNNNKTVNELKNDNIKKNSTKEKLKLLCNTPYRKININKSKRGNISTSPNVIIKNFNYNNVYNINIDNDKLKKTKNTHNKNKNNINRFSHKYITYNKPKTTSNLHIPCMITKKDINEVNNNDNINTENNNKSDNKRIISSRFNTEEKILNYPKDNYLFNSNLNNNNNNNEFKLNENNSYKSILKKKFNHDRLYTFTNFNDNKTYRKEKFFNIKTDDMGDNNNNNHPISENKNRIGSLTKSHILSLNNNTLKYISHTPVASNPYIDNKNENIMDSNGISFNLNDLNLIEDKINNIRNKFNIYNLEGSQECFKFIDFYSKSSLKGIFSTFFKENNNLIIQSSINLSLFSLIIIYHLTTNYICSNEILNIINNILLLFKINFSLYIRKIQLYYKIRYSKKNYIFFEPFIIFLNNENIIDIEKEEDIVYKIYQNCKEMTNNIKFIMGYYKSINPDYYNSFIKIFNNISIKNENELIDFFFTKVNNNSMTFITVNKEKKPDKKNNDITYIDKINQLKKYHSNINFGIFSPKKKSIFENLSIKNKSNIFKQSLKNSIKKKKNETVIRIMIPYIKSPPNKKYTLILDLNKTLAYINNKGNLKLRNGLFSFLSMIKPYYELISFSCEPKQITDIILNEIELEKKYFDYYFYREHSIIYENSLVKDLSLIGRDISKIIIVDDDENCFKLNKENGIKIAPFNENSINDNILFELKKILILICKNNYDDVREALNVFSNEIKLKISIA